MKNSLLYGVIFGAIAPLIAYCLSAYTELDTQLAADKPIILYVIAGAMNLIAARFLFRSKYDEIGKGIIISTFIAVLLLIFVLKLKI